MNIKKYKEEIKRIIGRGKGARRRSDYAVAVGLSLAAASVLLMIGTYAWRSISQEATNETIRSVDVGGRLHDDFDGTNKDVYAENYMTKNEGGVPLYVRIRLDEYMEIGKDAGENRNDPNRAATPVIAGSKLSDKNTWVTHIPKETDPTECTGSSASLHDYWTWTMGGSKVYLPTFNKNKDSLQADINGTYEGTTAGDSVHYDDYKSYVAGQELEGTATYDDDENDVEDANVYTKKETHTAVQTQNAVVMTMKQWKDLGSKSGKYWVYDTDGWAYWAEALQPGEVTGLLLDKVELTAELSEKCYYAINVVAQFATADDWGSVDDPVGFYTDYDPANGIQGPTEDALFLLNQAAGKAYQLTITADDASSAKAKSNAKAGNAQTAKIQTVQVGGTVTFTSEVSCMDRTVSDQTVVWSIKGAESKDTVIDKEGVLHIGADETADTLQITAKHSKKAVQTVLVEVVQQ